MLCQVFGQSDSKELQVFKQSVPMASLPFSQSESVDLQGSCQSLSMISLHGTLQLIRLFCDVGLQPIRAHGILGGKLIRASGALGLQQIKARYVFAAQSVNNHFRLTFWVNKIPWSPSPLVS